MSGLRPPLFNCLVHKEIVEQAYQNIARLV